jgi:iron complex outermembrane recepter protein
MLRQTSSPGTAGQFAAAALSLLLLNGRAIAQGSPTPTPTPSAPAVSETVVVSATRAPEIDTEIPGQVTVITGDQLRRQNVTNLADALQDVVGLDTGLGSDNGPRRPNVGMWGLKEFDALLFMVDGVPVGGAFNPSLSQINIDEIDRIEIVKGPQGTLYGVAAFAGMVQVFTKSGTSGTSIRIAAGSFSEGRLDASTVIPIGASKLRIWGDFDRAKGWQDRTDYKDDRGGFRIDTPLSGGGKVSVVYDMFRNTQFFGSPLPVDPPSGETLPGFQIDRNYEPVGARLDHRVYSLTALASVPINTSTSIENVIGVTRDNQISVRSFLSNTDNVTGSSSGIAMRPHETDVYDDLHLVSNFEAAGHHRFVGGAAITWGRTTASGYAFDFDFQIDPVVVPNLSDLPRADARSFSDRRTFEGFYVNDEWTPVWFLTITGGARYDLTKETLAASIQESGSAQATTSADARSSDQWSGGGSILARLVKDHDGVLNEANLYFSAKTAFKPAAPNLTQPSSARILAPERTRSQEAGVKTRWFDKQISFDAALFHMNFKNVVVSVVGPDGNPELTNAGETLFRGGELELGFHPTTMPDFSLLAGYAHHDATYVHFTFIDPATGATSADGQRFELTPRDLWNGMLSYHPVNGLGAWFAVRHQNHRPFDKINIAYMPSFFEYDAGLSYNHDPYRISIVGRNLGNSRHFVAESELGDAQDYVAPPRRFLAEISIHF